MRHLHRISEAEMIAVFLRAEVFSSRIVPGIQDLVRHDGRDLRIVTDPDIASAADNAYRCHLLGVYRGFRRDAALFAGFPTSIRWYRAMATNDDLAQVRYINDGYWRELSGGSRLPTIAAARIRQGIAVFRVSNAGFWQVSDAIVGGAIVPELIMVGARKDAPLVLVEGHARLTAYFLGPEAIPDSLQVIVGYARDIVGWELF